jgi:hypothetical protein
VISIILSNSYFSIIYTDDYTLSYTNGCDGAGGFKDKSQKIFDPQLTGSVINQLCYDDGFEHRNHVPVDCTKGVAVNGWSQGAHVASLAGNYHIIYDYWYATEVFRLSLWEHSHLQNTCVTRSSHQQLFPPCRCSLIIWNNDNNGIIVALDALFVEYLYLTVWVIGSCTSNCTKLL